MLFSLDLNTAFPVEVLLSPEFLHNTSIPSDITSDMISQAESVAYGGLLTSNNSLYVYGGGGTPDQNSQNVLASYDLTTSTWQSISILGDSCINEPRYFGQSASDLVSGLAFFLGGTGGFPGMLRFNTSNPSQVPCANQTLGSGSNGLSVPDTHGGAMVYLPVGEAGALLLLGGSNVSSSYKCNIQIIRSYIRILPFLRSGSYHLWRTLQSTIFILALGQSVCIP